MKNAFFWNVTPCDSCKNQRFGGIFQLLTRVIRNGELGTALAVTSYRRSLGEHTTSVASYCCVVPSTPIVTLMKEVLISSETSVLTRATRHNILEDASLQRKGSFLALICGRRAAVVHFAEDSLNAYS
jgi:hypothetical protein